MTAVTTNKKYDATPIRKIVNPDQYWDVAHKTFKLLGHPQADMIFFLLSQKNKKDNSEHWNTQELKQKVVGTKDTTEDQFYEILRQLIKHNLIEKRVSKLPHKRSNMRSWTNQAIDYRLTDYGRELLVLRERIFDRINVFYSDKLCERIDDE